MHFLYFTFEQVKGTVCVQAKLGNRFNPIIYNIKIRQHLLFQRHTQHSKFHNNQHILTRFLEYTQYNQHGNQNHCKIQKNNKRALNKIKH